MKRLIFVLSLVSVVGMSLESAEASGRRCGRRAARRCCVVRTCCVATPAPVQCCQPVTPAPAIYCQSVTPAPAICHQSFTPAPAQQVTSYKPASSGCQECEATQTVLNNTTVNGSLNAPHSGSPTLASGSGGLEAEMSHGQVLARINAYLDRVNDNICALKNRFPEYGTIINNLSSSEKMRTGDTKICYPSLEVWSTRPDVRDDVIRVLTANGVL